ncbi:unnamed protein product [Schistocephalus solidus]|uniref:AH domain-containing protein n=1 Tax=Schistocephalus solidus TaxID=70667 RepID=A0A183STK8_SCHSO|nr:unnamed protein product [Schistocephalus solidus]
MQVVKTDIFAALDVFCGGLETFCNHTVPDTLATIRNLEQSRIVYDAYRSDMERLHIPQDAPDYPPGSSETKYCEIKAAVDVKINMLHENRVSFPARSVLTYCQVNQVSLCHSLPPPSPSSSSGMRHNRSR